MEQKYRIVYHEKGPKKGKIDKIFHDYYSDFYFWNYEEQTKVKHKVLSEYLKVWFIKLGVGDSRINYYDGFSGCGAYYDFIHDEIGWGSPVIARKVAVENNRNVNCNFYFNETDGNNIKNLKAVLDYNEISSPNIMFTNEVFNDNINAFLDKLEKNPVPTFFMIDPYGIDVDFSVIERILKIPRTEILLNFMYNFFNRFITHQQSEDSINRFFGCTDWQQFRPLKGDKKEEALVNFYRERLKTMSKYVYQYRLSFAEQDKTYYYLIHMTQHIDGCSIMKDAFSSVNFGNVEFLGPKQPNTDQVGLIDLSALAINHLKDDIYKKYQNNQACYQYIVDEYIDNSPYLERQIKSALENMEGTHLKVIEKPQNTRKFQQGYVFQFFEKPVIKEEYDQIKLF